MEKKYTIIIALLLVLAGGFLGGISYQKTIGGCPWSVVPQRPNEEIFKINAIYGMAYVSDTATDTIGFNIISIDDPTEKHLKNDVLLNKHDMFLYTDTKYHRSVAFAFMGYDLSDKPVIRILKNLQERLDYEGEIFKNFGYSVKTIERKTGD